MRITKHEREVLAQFAAMNCPSSRYEVYGHDNIAPTQAAIEALCAANLLVALPTEVTRDRFGGTRFDVTAAGRRELGLAVAAKSAPKAVPTARPTPVLNGRHDLGRRAV